MNFQALGAILVPFAGSASVRFLPGVKTRNRTWYRQLKRPWFSPPRWAFAPAWAILYSSMGYASYLVFRDGGGFDGPAGLALALYGTQLLLNWAYNPILVGYGKLKLALADILCTDVVVAATAYTFYNINPVAGYLLIPYQIWLSLASAITYKLAMDNDDDEDATKSI